MFRVKLQASRRALENFDEYVKTGVRGMAIVRTDPKRPMAGRPSR